MRRVFYLAIGAFLLAGTAHSQERVARIGVLDWQSPSDERLGAFRAALQEFGHVEGKTFIIEYRSAEGQSDRAARHAAELALLPVDVLVALATPASHAAKAATRTIPVVMLAADPVGTGLVSNLARPEGNVTGVSTMLPELAPKRLELLREALPGITRIAFLASTRDPAAELFVRGTQEAAARFGMTVDVFHVGGPEEFEDAFARIASQGNQALIIQPLFLEHSRVLAELSARHRLAAIADYGVFARSGLLLAYGPDVRWQRRAIAAYADRILKGAKPADLPVEQPSQLWLVVNLRTARELGIALPASVLVRADEVIE